MEQPRAEEPHELALRFGYHAQRVLGGEWNDLTEEALRAEWPYGDWLESREWVLNGWNLARGKAQIAP